MIFDLKEERVGVSFSLVGDGIEFLCYFDKYKDVVFGVLVVFGFWFLFISSFLFFVVLCCFGKWGIFV